MSDRSSFEPDLPSTLRGPHGELVFVRLHVPARLLEDALEVLALASFPVNPEIRHKNPLSTIEFPAYDADVEEIRRLFRDSGLGACRIEIESALTAIR